MDLNLVTQWILPWWRNPNWMIGTLLYLTASRPDLQFAICMYARYQARPTEKHLNTHLQMQIMLVVKIHARSTSGSIQLLGDIQYES
ncbi:hypothetical protein Tco_0361766 [Tanacetum coccineum]